MSVLLLLCLLVLLPDPVAAGSLPSCEVLDPSMLDSLSDADSCLAAGVLTALLATLCMEPYCEAVRRPSLEKKPKRGGAGVGGDDLVGLSGILTATTGSRVTVRWGRTQMALFKVVCLT
jgi:hypothetical protein